MSGCPADQVSEETWKVLVMLLVREQGKQADTREQLVKVDLE